MKTYRQRTNEIEQKLQQERARAEKRRHNRIVKISAIAASVVAVVTIGAVVLFTPYSQAPRDLSAYSGSEYYELIKALDSTHFTVATAPSNNFEKWFGGLKFGAEAPGDAGNDYLPTTPEADGYQEVTDNQVEGVTEGDLFKRTESRIFYLNARTQPHVLSIYSIEKEDSKLISSYEIQDGDNMSLSYTGRSAQQEELYLSGDGKTVTLILPCMRMDTKAEMTAVINLDVSGETPREVNRAYLSGNYESSRYTDGQFLFVTSYYSYTTDYSDETRFVPQTGNEDGFSCLPMEDIYLPEVVSSSRYTVICTLDDDLNVTDSLAFLSYSSDVYVSRENLFVTESYFGTHKNEGVNMYGTTTKIACVSYTDGLEMKGSAEVAGSVLNRYSLDEYEGVLRVVTETNYALQYNAKKYSDEIAAYRQTSADLYCIDLQTFETVASVKRFAPLGERVRSVRFQEQTAYVCTAVVTLVEICDPVFMFDLSDLNDITYKDTGTIPGYSLALSAFSYDTLLGIGFGESDDTLKIELYRETEHDVVSVAQYERPFTTFSREYKAYLIDRENGYIGLGVYQYSLLGDFDFYGYILLRFDGTQLVQVAEIENEAYFDDFRATVIDGYLYLLSPNDITVQALS